jgi:peptidoglycan/LPS O-acetylase OafA/YrhL
MSLTSEFSAQLAEPVRPSATPTLQHGEIAGLDGLRALSVLSVMIGHFGFGNIVPGGLGVTIFYFISGFQITTLMLREARATGHVSVGRFYARRALRLQPELWALLIISGLGSIAFHNWPTLLDWLSGLLYVTNYAHEGVFTGGNVQYMRWPQLWSLAVEEHYYLTYPLLFIALMKAPARLMMALVAVLVGALTIRVAYVFGGVDSDIIYSTTETRIDSIAYGCIGSLLLWNVPQTLGDWVRRNGTAIASFGFVLLGVSVALRDQMFRDTLRYSLQGLALLLIFLSFYASSKPGLGVRLLEWSPLKWMGRMSYGAYLWHLELAGGLALVLHLTPQESPSLTAAIKAPIFCALSFAAAWLSYELFQRPVLALRRRFGAEARKAVDVELADVIRPVQNEEMHGEVVRR